MSTVLNATDADFAQIVAASDKPVLVDFWATWCGPCRQVAPILDQIAAEHPDDYTVVKVDIDAAPNTALAYNVMSVPTLYVLDADGNPREQFVGPKPKPVLVGALANAV